MAQHSSIQLTHNVNATGHMHKALDEMSTWQTILPHQPKRFGIELQMNAGYPSIIADKGLHTPSCETVQSRVRRRPPTALVPILLRHGMAPERSELIPRIGIGYGCSADCK